MAKADSSTKVPHSSRNMWVPIAKMAVDPVRQRKFNRPWVEKTAPDFDPDQIGLPVLNHVTELDKFMVIDGQHRVALCKLVLGEDQQVFCEVFVDLTPQQEAYVFLRRNNQRSVTPLDKFLIRLEEGDHDACDIERIVKHCGLKIGRKRTEDTISAVTALESVYGMTASHDALAKTVKALNFAYPYVSEVWDSNVIKGVGSLFARYNGKIPHDELSDILANSTGGLSGLKTLAVNHRETHGGDMHSNYAAALVHLVNKKRRKGPKLESWWSTS